MTFAEAAKEDPAFEELSELSAARLGSTQRARRKRPDVSRSPVDPPRRRNTLTSLMKSDDEAIDVSPRPPAIIGRRTRHQCALAASKPAGLSTSAAICARSLPSSI
jgi:hypothetical protein